MGKLKKIWLLLLSIGPGLFCIGYTIGTGSVTSMLKAGSLYGMQLLWVLVLSAFFSGVLMDTFGKMSLVTGKAAIYTFRTELRNGRLYAILVVLGVVVGQWSALSGIIGLSSNALYEMLRLFIPSLNETNYWAVLFIAFLLLSMLYFFLLIGKYSAFEKVLVVMVTLMGVCFLVSMFIVFPSPEEIFLGLKPSIPAGGELMVAAFVGTTMAAPTFVVRPLIVQEKGWTLAENRLQRNDAIMSALLMFVISASIMIVSTGVLFHDGKPIMKVMDMVHSMEPLAGKFAVAVFMIGVLSAGVSSAFPIMMVLPLLLGDYSNGKMDVTSPKFKMLTAIAAVVGLTVPVLGANPIIAQIATQVANVFVLPLVILCTLIVINKISVMKEHKASLWLNAILGLAFLFSLAISYNGIIGLMNYFTEG
ncbi:Nramp family divalent metal transporter [Fulvivirgaceae bacterium BMA10]|uniref:Nramp family divalent metal transporter n=1 Tax=Splendidivirga corallicola TaxID=3051826 RepID=A0ABT8KY15_9BACT|nr:Nramp family divalent metal transporter [Fulvivirgaceae bacterium BMA10]